MPENTIESSQHETRPQKIVVKNRGEATVKILEYFKQLQKENYSSLDFHNEKHPEMVRHAALEFAKIITRIDPRLVTKNTLEEIVGSAAAHDSVLNFAHGEMITRFRGFFDTDIEEKYRLAMAEAGINKGNELLSAEELEEELARYVDPSGEPVFHEAAKKETREAIAATFPKFDFAAKITDDDFEKYFGNLPEPTELKKYQTGIKVYQPHLGPDSSITTLAIATGDLHGKLATEDYEDYRKSGNAEFRELNEGLRAALSEGAVNIPQEIKAKKAIKMLEWVRAQITFAMWQKILFWKSIDENKLIAGSEKSAKIKEALKNRYDHCFDRNILEAQKRYEKLLEKYGEPAETNERLQNITKVDFEELLRELGFEE